MTKSPSTPPDPVAPAIAAPAPLMAGAQVPALRASPEPPPAPAPRPTRRRWVWLAGLVLAGGGAAAMYFQPWVAGPVPVAVEIAALAPTTRVLAVNGRIAARQSVEVQAQVGGVLADLPVAEGDVVAVGDVVARLDATTPQAVLRQTMAGLDAALVEQAQAEDTLARTTALGANVPRTTLEAATRALQSAVQEVARASAQVDQTRATLANYTLTAPLSGTVLVRNVEQGQTIDTATRLMTIADLKALIVETDVDEAYATQIRVGQPTVMQLAGETATRTGRVSFVSQRVEATTGGLALQLAFDTDVVAPVGLTVATNIIVDRRDAAITVPRAAITADGGVFVIADGTAQRRAVQVIDWPAARLIVTDGLLPGDVVIQDATGITAGQTVQRAQP
jgi:RND family efflux transporter MFP subunit